MSRLLASVLSVRLLDLSRGRVGMHDMERSLTPGMAPEDMLGLLATAGPVGSARAHSLVAPADDPADRVHP